MVSHIFSLRGLIFLINSSQLIPETGGESKERGQFELAKAETSKKTRGPGPCFFRARTRDGMG